MPLTPPAHKRSVYEEGFTLLEVMVALVIFSLIAIGSLTVLVNLRDTQTRLEEGGKRLEDLQSLILMTRHGLSQMVPISHPPDPSSGGQQANDYITTSPTGQIIFARNGWFNPLGEGRSYLAYTSYSINAGALKEDISPFLLYNIKAPAVSARFGSDITNLQFHSIEQAPDNGKTPAEPVMPRAVDLAFTSSSFGEIEEIIPLVQVP